MQNDDTLGAGDASGAGLSRPGATWSQEALEGDDRYRREALLAVGGMGEVHLAWDHKLARHVAIKVARGGDDAAARLIAEAQHTASLDHPMIVSVHDTGVTPEGRPFYAMRLIRGRALSEALRGAGPGERLRLLKHVQDACHAVAYAHSLGVLHRDLKPANVMIGAFGETQVVDWGLGTRRGPEATSAAEAGVTIAGSVLGTPAYMSPEQARGERVDARADVWGLGTILYEVITGRAPHGGDDVSTAMTRVRSGEVPPAATIAPDMPRELCAIVDRALQCDPALRYDDAGKLAEEIARYMAGGRVDAHVYSPWELLRRVIRAWKGPLVVTAIAIVVVITLVTLGGLRLAASRERAVAAEAETRAALVVSDTNYRRALVAQATHAASEGRWAEAEVCAVEALLGNESPEARGVLMAADALGRASLVERIPVPDCKFPEFTRDGIVCGGTSLSHWVDGARVWSAPSPVSRIQVAGPWIVARDPDNLVVADVETGQVATTTLPNFERFSVSATGWLATSYHHTGVDLGWITDLSTGQEYLVKDDCPQGVMPEIVRLHAEPARRLIRCVDGTMTIGDLDGTNRSSWSTGITEAASGGALGLAIDPRAERAVMGMVRGAVVLVDLLTGEAASVDSPHGAASEVVWAPDGASFAVRRDRGTVEIWDPRGLTIVGHLPVEHARRIAHGDDGVLRVLEPEAETRWTLTPSAAPAVLKDRHGVGTAAFSPDGRALATGHGGAHTVVWDLTDGSRRFALESTGTAVKAVAWAPDGATLYSKTSGEVVIRRNDARTGLPLPIFGPRDALRRMITMHDGTLLAIGIGHVNSLWSLDPATETSREVSGCEAIEWVDADTSPDARSAVLVGAHGEIGRVLGDACTPVVRGLGAFRGAIADDGETVVIATDIEVALVTGDQVLWRTPAPGVRDLAVSSDGQFAAAGSLDHTARVLDMHDGRVLAVLVGHTERVVWVGFRPDSSQLATGSWDGTVRMWPLRRLQAPVAELAQELSDPGYPRIDTLLRR
jgi:WD40 repeat protein